MINHLADPWYIQLRDRLVTYFDESEISSLCFDLGIDYEELAGDTKGEKAMELIQFTARRAEITSLIQQCAVQRPNLEWESLKIAAAKNPVFWEAPEPETHLQTAATIRVNPPARKAVTPLVIMGGLLILLILCVFGAVKVLQSLVKPQQAQTGLPSATAQLAAQLETPQLETPQVQPAAYVVTASLPGEITRVGQQRYQVLETYAEPDTADHFLLKLRVRMYNDERYPAGLWAASFRHLEDGNPRQPDVQNAYTNCNAAVGGEAASDACYLVFSSSIHISDLQLKITGADGKAEMSLPVTFTVAAPGTVLPTSTPALPGGPFTVSASISTEQVRLGEVRYQALSLTAEPYSSDKVLLTLQMSATNDGIVGVNFWLGSFRLLEDGIPREAEGSSVYSCNIVLDGQSSSDACRVQFVVSVRTKEIKLRIFNDLGAESFLPVTLAVTRP